MATRMFRPSPPARLSAVSYPIYPILSHPVLSGVESPGSCIPYPVFSLYLRAMPCHASPAQHMLQAAARLDMDGRLSSMPNTTAYEAKRATSRISRQRPHSSLTLAVSQPMPPALSANNPSIHSLLMASHSLYPVPTTVRSGQVRSASHNP